MPTRSTVVCWVTGIASVGLNFRSCSGELNKGLRLYHSGETSDLGWVIDRLRDQYPERTPGRRRHLPRRQRVTQVPLGERPCGRSRCCCGVVRAFLLVKLAGARYMERGFAQRYVGRLLRSLKVKVLARKDELGGAH